jgi:hypothetical protein
VGINTGHVGTSDFVLEEDDRKFAVSVSFIQYMYTRFFCKEYINGSNHRSLCSKAICPPFFEGGHRKNIFVADL